MTKVPFLQRHKVRPAEGDPYLAFPSVCSNPWCGNQAVDRHHLVRRSELGGAHDWVEYDGVKIGNICGLCRACHGDVTDNRVWIRWNELGYFEWDTQLGYINVANGSLAKKLDPHPPVGDTPDMSGGYMPPPQPDVCPECKRPHRKKTADEQVRNRKSWTIHVPVDERENGADVLDTLLEEARKMMAEAGLAYGDEDKARYFVLTAALGLFVQHGQVVMGDA